MGDNKTAYLIGLLGGFNMIAHVKLLDWCLTHSKNSIKILFFNVLNVQ